MSSLARVTSMSLDKEIVQDFVDESKSLIEDLILLLESLEGQFGRVHELEDYGNRIDRIMGGAKSLALMADATHPLHIVADYTALCKAVGYKASQIKKNEKFFDICVALLLDATETLDQMLGHMDKSGDDLKKSLSHTFLERVRWVSSQFSDEFRGSVDAGKKQSQKMSQDDIDELMKKLGL